MCQRLNDPTHLLMQALLSLETPRVTKEPRAPAVSRSPCTTLFLGQIQLLVLSVYVSFLMIVMFLETFSFEPKNV